MKISFIIPTLNEETVIKETIEKLLLYSGESEIIISDGGSTDKTLEIVMGFHNPRVIAITHTSKKRQTIAEGRNIGAFRAKGEYIIELDADTHIPHIDNFINECLRHFENNLKTVALSTWFRVYKHTETFADRFWYGLTGLISLIVCNFFHKACTSGGEFQMIRKESFIKIGGFNESLIAMEDNDLFKRLLSVGDIHFMNKLHIYHSGRRAHKVGWTKLIAIFLVNGISVLLTGKIKSKEWTVVR